VLTDEGRDAVAGACSSPNLRRSVMMVGTRSASRRHSVATAGESGSPAAGNSGMGETAGVREGGDSGGARGS
jgi:hypothetical protein